MDRPHPGPHRRADAARKADQGQRRLHVGDPARRECAPWRSPSTTRGSTSAGGFILPNDRVDVIHTVQAASESGANPATSEIILTNIRVLAIGQTVQERNGEKVVTGETATLELTPAQAEKVVLAQKVGQLSLALRSIADVNETGTPAREERNALQVIRYGVQQQAPAR